MVLASDSIAHDQDAQIVGRKSSQAQRSKLRDRIILAIARAANEEGERRGPDIALAILRLVAHRTDGKIDGAVDFAELRAPRTLAGGINDGEQPQRGRRHA